MKHTIKIKEQKISVWADKTPNTSSCLFEVRINDNFIFTNNMYCLTAKEAKEFQLAEAKKWN